MDLRISVVDEPWFIKLFDVTWTEKDKLKQIELKNHSPFEYYVDEQWGADGNCEHYILDWEIIYQKLSGITLQPKSNYNPSAVLWVSPDPDADKFDIISDNIQSIYP